ncbi:MAG: hypothetical protein LUB59_05665 [Candidatus Gastranaerophilales bacterium]|nr:hypothetical protein [Candidatus Gastranaerophilales bacterium]
MGMAASQARYLSLSARKTNTEYEGQQINQQRLNLSNQSADLFNQMLTMSVPTCPDSNDYTTLQYSWSDGNNTYVLSDYYQIATANSDYNYVATSYYYTDVYTGSQKKMVEPQIQCTKTNDFTRNDDKDYTVTQLTYVKETSAGAGDDSYTLSIERNGVESKTTFVRSDQNTDTDTVEELDEIFNRTATTSAGTSYTNDDDGVLVICSDVTVANPDYDPEEEESDTNPKTITLSAADTAYTDDDGNTISGVTFNIIDTDDEEQADIISLLRSSYGAAYDSSNTYYYTVDENGNYYFVCGEDAAAAEGSQGDAAKVQVRSGDDTVYYTNGTYFLTADELAAIDIDNGVDTLSFHSATNDPVYSDYTAVGNCDLTAISVDDYDSDDTISVAIQQIIADMKTTSSEAYANLSACFDSNTGEYLGGIYSFQLYGTTYYTTEADLASAASGAYDDDATASNGIDSQNKLSYYNATYISTKIEETANALLETDGYGRFTSVKFENDSVTYTLNCETITDEDAYNNAMNQYYYEQEQYDQEVASINAKTEIIQAEDRELQLRLEQLDTEQSALQTEMEACQKVVSKNVEDGFKTFNH